MLALVSIVALRFQLQTWTPFVWERLQKPKNRAMNTTHHAVAVLENVGGGAVPVAYALLSPKPPSVVVARTALRGWGRGGYTSAGAGMQQGHKELHVYASTQQVNDELYAGMQQRLEEFLITWQFSNLALFFCPSNF